MSKDQQFVIEGPTEESPNHICVTIHYGSVDESMQYLWLNPDDALLLAYALMGAGPGTHQTIQNGVRRKT